MNTYKNWGIFVNEMKKVKKSYFKTADGSPTLYMDQFDEYYHSKHGALQEAMHVYLEMGFEYWQTQHLGSKQCHIFEMGFGTGLNAFLTAKAAKEANIHVCYHTIEAYPLSSAEMNEVNYFSFLDQEDNRLFKLIHNAHWEEEHSITSNFKLKKVHCLLEDYIPEGKTDLIYYDAFGARAQPEIWADECFPKLTEYMNPGAVFVTYAAIGRVRRTLLRLGLETCLVPGPPGKREMIRGLKPLL